MFDIASQNLMLLEMRKELTLAGVTELKTPDDVQSALTSAKGSTVVFVNSVCGCAAGKARPGFVRSLKHSIVPDNLFTVFAGQDKDATAEARKFFGEMPPSSPSIAFFNDGKFLGMIHRHQIESRSAEMIAGELTTIYDTHFAK
jgi:putative YphP/YqiW family bacilliredoxin